MPKQLIEDGVPRKCNTRSLLIIKYTAGCKTNKDIFIGGYDSTRKGDKGAKSFYYYFILPTLEF
jgi:hypothetical protein